MLSTRNILFFSTLFIALALNLVNLPGWVNWLRPNWILLVIAFWTLSANKRFSILLIWGIGIILDALNGTLLGEHALALVVATYALVKLSQRIRFFLLWQQACMIFLISLLYLSVLWLVEMTVGEWITTPMFFVSALINALLWPWLLMLLNRLFIR